MNLTGWSPPASQHATPRRRRGWRWRWIAVATLVLLMSTWFGGGALMRHRVDDNLVFAPPARTANGSLTVDVAAGLITREIDQHGWQPNDPWFYPTALTDNAAHFQSGMMWAISRLSTELTDRVGRLGSVGRIDEDLQRATGLLQYPGDVWVFDLRSLMPAPSETQYRSARDALMAYNGRLSQGKAVFEARADNLAALLNRIARDLGAEADSIENFVAQSNFAISRSADDLFYQVKGASYAYAVLFKAMQTDFAPVIKDTRLQTLWAAAGQALDEAASMRPMIVLDAAPDGSLFANHLAIEGYYILRVKARLLDLVSALRV